MTNMGSDQHTDARINAALALLNGMNSQPHPTGTHHHECHNYHHECLVARLRHLLDPDTNTNPVATYGDYVLVNAAFLAEHERYETALRDLASHGTRHDPHPTEHATFEWHAYLRSADQHVRDTAQRALENR